MKVVAAHAITLAAVGVVVVPPAPANADLCPYPGVGVGANVLFGHGGFCDFPTEINGAHMHCETGGFSLGGGIAFTDTGGFGGGVSGGGIGGASCSWRCPDNTMAPAPNPPGAWKSYMVPMESTNWCFLDGHMEPAAGHWSSLVLPTEGIPAESEPLQIAPGTPNP